MSSLNQGAQFSDIQAVTRTDTAEGSLFRNWLVGRGRGVASLEGRGGGVTSLEGRGGCLASLECRGRSVAWLQGGKNLDLTS